MHPIAYIRGQWTRQAEPYQVRQGNAVAGPGPVPSNHYGGLDSKMDTAAGLKRMQRLTEFLLSMSIYKLAR
jgi:hypothetical protein